MARKKKSVGFFGKIKDKAGNVKKHGQDLAQIAAERAPDAHATIKKHGKDKLLKGISAAKNIRSTSSAENIELLEKLGDLRDKGILTDKEFQVKKKEILEKL